MPKTISQCADINHRVWAETLAETLAGIDTIYSALGDMAAGRMTPTPEQEDEHGIIYPPDPSDLTHQTARALSRVLEALGDLPNFANGRGLIALTSLRTAIVALDDGSHPTLLAPRPRTSKGGDHVGKRAYKANVVLCIELLQAAGLNNSPARRFVAEAFSAAGHRGQGGGSVSASTLFAWQRDLEPAERKFVNKRLADFRASARWQGDIDGAKEWVLRRSKDKLILHALTI